MKYVRLLLTFLAVFMTLFSVIALPIIAAGHPASWYTVCVLGSASALITAVFALPTTVPRETKDTHEY